MDNTQNYIGWLRSKVGHEKIRGVFAQLLVDNGIKVLDLEDI